jgi:hypothetical protein
LGNGRYNVRFPKTFVAPELRTGCNRKDTFLTNPTLTPLQGRAIERSAGQAGPLDAPWNEAPQIAALRVPL